jgi:hypothetical protein
LIQLLPDHGTNQPTPVFKAGVLFSLAHKQIKEGQQKIISGAIFKATNTEPAAVRRKIT